MADSAPLAMAVAVAMRFFTIPASIVALSKCSGDHRSGLQNGEYDQNEAIDKTTRNGAASIRPLTSLFVKAPVAMPRASVKNALCSAPYNATAEGDGCRLHPNPSGRPQRRSARAKAWKSGNCRLSWPSRESRNAASRKSNDRPAFRWWRCRRLEFARGGQAAPSLPRPSFLRAGRETSGDGISTLELSGDEKPANRALAAGDHGSQRRHDS